MTVTIVRTLGQHHTPIGKEVDGSKGSGSMHAGAVLVTPDGKWPAADQEDAVEAALQKCGIKRWSCTAWTTPAPFRHPSPSLRVRGACMNTLQPQII